MNKRAGFTSRFLLSSRIRSEKFDTVFGTFPNRLYVLTDEGGKYAITGESDSDYIVMKPVDKKNKYQWVLVDGDTGTICFFTDLKNYMSVSVGGGGDGGDEGGTIHVKRSEILKNGTFTFNSDKTLTMKNGFSDYCLAFRRKKEEVESFLSFGGRKELFNADEDIALEIVKRDEIDSSYSNKWKFELVYDLRELVGLAEMKEDIEQVNASGNSQIEALQKIIELNKKQYETELGYKDDLINRYEGNWFVRTFLKK